MSLFRLLLIVIFVYIGFKMVQVLRTLYKESKKAKRDDGLKRDSRSKINIKKEDIIEADFEEIDPDKSESKNSKQ